MEALHKKIVRYLQILNEQRVTPLGRITDIKLPGLSDKLEDEIGCEIEDYELTVHYVCADCRRPKRAR